ncbi:F-box/kelch-repeat protein At3g23880-like [Lolium rigidum]|uniref:F-box/kelch-repeat protein At3g23880-like n=1 Tax=Lolium rigidum TaxID=89674 RepID=UPI001F5D4A5F|nr:F-box/kelch-repeat protein At3g23880-like [Lolium rigidum]
MDVEDDETRRLPPTRYLPHELIVSEILVRLPVKSLLRFRCVCKAWRDTVSGDTSFSEAHTRRLRQQKRRPSSLLIAPYITIFHPDVDLMKEYAIPGLYLWEENQRQHGVATLVHDMAWFPVQGLWKRHGFAHCDGLVMLPDFEGTVHVLNPATRRRLTLPSTNNTDTRGPNVYGFGRNPSSGAYKIAHFFRVESYSLRMEVFTVGEDHCWRETAAKPPYPFINERTATFFKGSLIWMVDLRLPMYHNRYVPHESSFVRFGLEDKLFSIMAGPQWYPGRHYEESRLAELHGELALARRTDESVEIWICEDVNQPLCAIQQLVNSSNSNVCNLD